MKIAAEIMLKNWGENMEGCWRKIMYGTIKVNMEKRKKYPYEIICQNNDKENYIILNITDTWFNKTIQPDGNSPDYIFRSGRK